jgi:molybdopterin-binding protein
MPGSPITKEAIEDLILKAGNSVDAVIRSMTNMIMK